MSRARAAAAVWGNKTPSTSATTLIVKLWIAHLSEGVSLLPLFPASQQMLPSILGLLTRAIATVYGLLALGVSVLYSLSRKDTWTRPLETTVSDFQNGK